MDTNTYSKLALRTANDLGEQGNLLHATLLISSESGEVAGAVKKHFAYGRKLDRTHLIEELGDLAWGINLMLRCIDSSWEEIFEVNISKLSARYPSLRFDANNAINRDKEMEQAVIGVAVKNISGG